MYIEDNCDLLTVPDMAGLLLIHNKHNFTQAYKEPKCFPYAIRAVFSRGHLTGES